MSGDDLSLSDGTAQAHSAGYDEAWNDREAGLEEARRQLLEEARRIIASWRDGDAALAGEVATLRTSLEEARRELRQRPNHGHPCADCPGGPDQTARAEAAEVSLEEARQERDRQKAIRLGLEAKDELKDGLLRSKTARIQTLEASLDSLKFELQALEHVRTSDNAYLLARIQTLEAALREAQTAWAEWKQQSKLATSMGAHGSAERKHHRQLASAWFDKLGAALQPTNEEPPLD